MTNKTISVAGYKKWDMYGLTGSVLSGTSMKKFFWRDGRRAIYDNGNENENENENDNDNDNGSSCSVIVRVSVVLKRTVGDSD